MAKSIAFYTQCLGFTLAAGGGTHSYSLLVREEAMIALIIAADDDVLKATRENISAQIWVTDLGAMWDQIAPQVQQLPKERWKAPHDRDYGVREVHIKDPDGFLMFFTQLPKGA